MPDATGSSGSHSPYALAFSTLPHCITTAWFPPFPKPANLKLPVPGRTRSHRLTWTDCPQESRGKVLPRPDRAASHASECEMYDIVEI
jgi:hypothetical protein